MDDRLLCGGSQGGEREAQVHQAEGRHSIPASRLHGRLFCELNGKQREDGAITMNDKLL